ncbi:MAG TPA: nitrous oxide-stimulated promoter family protein [Usitatibacter sp.]|nr:nitrous oxide-stimulated promoter family protein [Usitatibacter sp.]
MERKVVEFRTDKRFARRARELRTLETMMAMYCRHHHGGAPLCPDCVALSEYAQRRLERCVFGDAKPTCANCLVHCYRDDMREKVRVMMRWAGPRMLFRHPVVAVRHMIDGRRPAPMLPVRPARREPPGPSS